MADDFGIGSALDPEQKEELQEFVITSTRKGETKPTTIDNNRLKIYRFPLDIGSGETPYVLFKIFKTVTSGQIAPSADDPTTSLKKGAEVVSAGYNAITNVAGETATNAVLGAAVGGTVGALIGAGVGAVGANTVEGAVNSVGNFLFGEGVNLTSKAKELVENFSLKRNIEQISDAIALFIPEGVNSSYSHEWNTVSVTSAFGLIGFAGQALSARNGVDAIDPYIAEAAGSIVGRILGGEDFARLGTFAATGRTINPQLELLYSNPSLRSFEFEFVFNPLQQELWSVQRLGHKHYTHSA